MKEYNWHLKKFSELTTLELYKILKLRIDTFVVEQNCNYEELDNKDLECYHLFLENDEGNVIAYSRLLPPKLKYEEVSIGRVVVDFNFRGENLGISLLEKAVSTCFSLWDSDIKISAQAYLKSFYEKFRFKQISDEYDDAGIMHIDMLLKKEFI